jgi:hypothetical protein
MATASKKLVEFVKVEIKKRTKLFYSSELSLDKSDDIDTKYGGDYLKKLDGLTVLSEPDQVINAFRVVALIAKTQNLQSDYDTKKEELNKKTQLAKCKEIKNK